MKLSLYAAGSHHRLLGGERPGNTDVQGRLSQVHAGALTEIKTVSPLPKFHVTKQNVSCGQTFQENRRNEKLQPSSTRRPVPVGRTRARSPPHATERR